MPTLNSDQYEKAFAGQVAQALKDNEWGGRTRAFYFSRATSAAKPIANGDIVMACRIPKNARILGGNITFGAMGASTTIKVGTAADAIKYLGSTSVAAAGSAVLANTQALNYGEELSADTDIILTCEGANYAADKEIRGHLLVSLT